MLAYKRIEFVTGRIVVGGVVAINEANVCVNSLAGRNECMGCGQGDQVSFLPKDGICQFKFMAPRQTAEMKSEQIAYQKLHSSPQLRLSEKGS